MKRVLSMCMAAVMFGAFGTQVSAEDLQLTANTAANDVWDGSVDLEWYSYGYETEYHIRTASEFAGFAQLVNAGGSMSGKSFYLDNDIYLNDISNYANWAANPPANEWATIGKYVSTGNEDDNIPFSGHLYGQGHSIHGVYQNMTVASAESTQDGVCLGLFGYTSGALIDNLSVTESYIHYEYTKTDGSSQQIFVGGICSYAKDTCFVRCTHDGVIGVKSVIGWIGGICGYFSSFGVGGFAKCVNHGEIIFTGINADIKDKKQYLAKPLVGGICNYGGAEFAECHNDALIYAESAELFSSDYGCAGIGRKGNSTAFIKCINSGTVQTYNQSDQQDNAIISSGIAGVSDKQNPISLRKCYDVGTVENLNTTSNKHCGAILGKNNYAKEKAADEVFFLSSSAPQAFGEGDDGYIFARSEEYMKSPEFAEKLGDGFVYVENDYPLLTYEAAKADLPGNLHIDGIDYRVLSDGTLAVTGLETYGKSVTIPASVSANGSNYVVTELADHALEWETFSELHLPETLRAIGSHALSCCINLHELIIPVSVKKLGTDIFGSDDYSYFKYIINSAVHYYCTPIDTLYYASEMKNWCSINGCAENGLSDGALMIFSDIRGDLNGDGNVNLKDVVLLRRTIAGGWNVSLHKKAADLNEDGAVNLKDAVLLRRYIAGGWDVEFNPNNT